MLHLDVAQAFLNAKIDEEVYVGPPDGDPDQSTAGFVYKLHSALYGLVQAPMLWAKTLRAFLEEIGFKVIGYEGSIYRLERDGQRIILVTYVDDIQMLYHKDHEELANSVIKTFNDKFEITDEGDLKLHLGVHYIRDQVNHTTFLSQQKYVETILERFRYLDLNPVRTPAESDLKMFKAPESELLSPDEAGLYREQLGCLQYLASMTRPDLSYIVGQLARYMQNPGTQHVVALKRVFRYVNGSRDRGLMFRAGSPSKPVGYSDSDWGNDIDTRRSVSGSLFILHGAAVSWKSKMQPTVALSTAEAEYMAASRAAQEALYICHLLRDLGYELSEPTVIYEDNQGCISMSKNSVMRDRCKHIDQRVHFLRDLATSGDVEMVYKDTKNMTADALTKPVPADLHIKHSNTMLYN
mmetsp:Transcript_40744/g.83342  ORF Transcript_40744/g.83342 Transcript_40744/m.83342 type:complete len:410 (-) Transcript_40744:207-1436(-)|eukprot:CAMPEP_0181341406 /NCGR_PEP_ID=MMETSP1101-20121128/30395_1 /TAXON_ID=46948 /ORGANISM="Rhodomonas abbreviata, Strain Caron Lab Isolate" /LENGTH=409 /DNA_ID=CAMNT_0023452685 /DNA_START=543 /DNA_END=1775 /DNA_ORIENTATION=-